MMTKKILMRRHIIKIASILLLIISTNVYSQEPRMGDDEYSNNGHITLFSIIVGAGILYWVWSGGPFKNKNDDQQN